MNFTTELPMLVVTTDPSWQHFSKWWAELVEPQLEGDARDQGEGRGADEGREDRRREDQRALRLRRAGHSLSRPRRRPAHRLHAAQGARDDDVALGRVPRRLDPADVDAARERASMRIR